MHFKTSVLSVSLFLCTLTVKFNLRKKDFFDVTWQLLQSNWENHEHQKYFGNYVIMVQEKSRKQA